MADGLEVKFGAETSGLERGRDVTKDAVLDVRRETEKATKAADALRAAFRQALGAQPEGLSTTTQRAGRAVDGLKNSARAAGTEVNRFGRETNNAGNQAQGAASKIDRAAASNRNFERSAMGARAAGALLAATLGVIGLRQVSDDLQDAAFAGYGLRTALAATTDGARGGGEALAFIEERAEALGLVVRDASAGFVGLAGATNGTRLEGQATRDIWEGLIIGGVALNRSNEQLKRGQEALTQIASKGVVSMEEIRQQLSEAIPGAVQIGARALGITTRQFNDLVASGKLLSEDFLPKFAAQLRREFGPALEAALNSPLGRARREMSEFTNATFEIKQAAGAEFLSEMVVGLRRVNEELRSPEGIQKARNIGESLGKAFVVGADGALFLANNIDRIVFAAQALAGGVLVKWLVTAAAEARTAAGAYAAKGIAARAASASAIGGMVAEGAANVTLTGQITAAARAEVVKAEASLATARSEVVAAEATVANARAQMASTSAGLTYAQRKAALTAANGQLIVAENGAAAAAGRLAAAQGVAAAASTRLGAAMLTARAAGAGLLALVGGPWGAAFMAAAAGVWLVVRANEAQEKKFRDVADAVQATAAEYEAARKAQAALGTDSGRLVTAQDAAAVAAAALTGEVNLLANAHYRAAAAAKAQIIEELRLKAIAAGEDASAAVANFNTRRNQAERRVRIPRGEPGAGAAAAGMALVGTDQGERNVAAAAAMRTNEYRVMGQAADNARTAAANLRAEQARGLASYLPDEASATGGGGGGGDKKGGKGPGRVAQWQQELEAMLAAEENFFGDSRDAEIAFWEQKRNATAAGSSDRLEIDRKLFALRRGLAQEDLRAELETIDAQQQAAEGNFAEQLRLQDEKMALLRDAYGEDSREYQRALQDKLRMEQAAAAETLEITRDALRSAAEAQRAAAEADRDVREIALDEERDRVENLARLGVISAATKMERLRQVAEEQRRLEAETAQRIFAIQKAALDAQLRLEGLKPRARAEIQAQIEALEVEHANRMRVLTARQASDSKRETQAAAAEAFSRWKSMFDPVSRGVGDMVNALTTGSRSLRDVWASVGQGLLDNTTQWLSRIVSDWIANQATMAAAAVAGGTARTAATAAEAAAQAGIVAGKVGVHAAGEGMKTGATVAGVVSRTAAEESGAAVSIATSAAVTLADVANSAIRAAAGAYAALAGVPFIGPVLAPAAAAAALGAVLALGKSIFSAREGWERVPYDGAKAELHRDEMVLPARIANPLRSMIANVNPGATGLAAATAGQAGADARAFDVAERQAMADAMAMMAEGGAGGGDINLSAFDAQDVKRYLERHAKASKRGLERLRRNFQTEPKT